MVVLNPPGTPPGAWASLLGMASLHSGQAHVAVVRVRTSNDAQIDVSLRMMKTSYRGACGLKTFNITKISTPVSQTRNPTTATLSAAMAAIALPAASDRSAGI